MKGDKPAFGGQMAAIFDDGEGASLGDADPAHDDAQLQVAVPAADGSVEGVIVHGTAVDTQSFVANVGGEITQPLVAADLVEVAGG